MVARRSRIALAATIVGVVAAILCVLAPLRQVSGDTVPGRLGGAVLRCNHSFDLAHIDWVKAMSDDKVVYYWFEPDDAGEWTSVFGPAPAVIGSLALFDFGPGDTIADATLRRRTRGAAAVLLGLAAALLVIAAAARSSIARATLVGVVAVASFAGAASLGQGLWQATTALPFVTGALATLAWREHRPGLRFVTPALLLAAVMLRPTIAPLVAGLGLAWAIGARDRCTWLVALAIALAVVAPLVAWNVVHLSSPFPLGQWRGNLRTATVDVFSLGNVATAVAGLVASPGRGLVWFAPVAIAGIVVGARGGRELRCVALGCVLQVLAMAAFFKWHGGQAFGPRLLAEVTWVGCWLALGAGGRMHRAIAALAIAVTVAVGQLGLWQFEPEQWETRRVPEAHPSAFWDVVDSPIPAAFTTADPKTPRAIDSDSRSTWRCDGERIRTN